MEKDPRDDPKRIALTFIVSDDIVLGANSISLDSYERLLAHVERTGMSIDEVLDDLIARTLPAPHGEDGDDG